MEKEKRSPIAATGIAMVTALALLAPLGGFLLWRHLTAHPGMRWDLAPPGSAPAGASSAEAQRPPHQFATEDADEPKKSAPLKKVVAKAKAAPKPAPRPAPPPSSIPAGMERSKLLAAFGKPQMITVEIQNGQPIETFHYLQRDSGMETIVRLSAGRVVSAGATVY